MIEASFVLIRLLLADAYGRSCRMGAGVLNDQTIISVGSPGTGRGWRSPVANDLTNHTYVTNCCKHPSMMGFKELLGWCTHHGAGRVVLPEVMGTPHPSPHPALCISSIQLSLSWLFYNKLKTVSKALSWVLWAVLVNYQTWGWVVRIPEFIASWSEIPVTAWDLWLASEVGSLMGLSS